jgi:NADH:ubiquinone oxidoreductase subunit 5 (subunit L)/multisubunit Na+/H+ antiporter MnhA subunit
VIDGVVNLVAFLGWLWSYLVELVDRYIVDGLGVNGTARTTAFFGNVLSYTETGRVRQYIVLTVLGLLILSGVCAYAVYHF